MKSVDRKYSKASKASKGSKASKASKGSKTIKITCKNCEYYESLHDRKHFSFWARGVYYCAVHERITDADNFCEQWAAAADEEIDLSAERFSQAEADIMTMIDLCGDVEA